ncbi:MAG TPA: class II glutamine amidotransferase [Mycobacterium sp.]|nr:MAG: class II glutamine amidotransferase [Mycobacterium sp.]HOB48987.1 class II glutamine amidotransferase [Mycobacterium sp.]HPZ95906.1 class II glutamine amidotransferase [Mycobacterium sp.]HQE14446.1 class II glutamine amidotransferase [Mycobacterium sp.]
MCRLFGLHAGRRAVAATFWLLDAPDSLAAQSRRNPDGTGVGAFDAGGRPELRKQPMAAWDDRAFATEAHEMTGTTFLAHVRYATTGVLDVANTHPFLQDRRMFAHNGVVEGLDLLDDRLKAEGVSELVGGQTDSERIVALITAAARRNGGDVTAAIREAVGWVADNVPVYALNILLSTATDLWALRYPESHELYLLDRPRDGALEMRTRRIRAHSEHLAEIPSVVVASEPMDDDPAWRLLDPGELVHVDADLNITRRLEFPDPPKHLLRHEDLAPQAQAAQHSQRQFIRR